MTVNAALQHWRAGSRAARRAFGARTNSPFESVFALMKYTVAVLVLAIASPTVATTYFVTPGNFVATANAALGGDIIMPDPSLPTTTVFPGWDHAPRVYASNPMELRLGNYTFGTLRGDLTNAIVRGGIFDAGTGQNAINGKFTDVKFLENKVRNGNTAFAAQFYNVYIENIEFSGSRSDALHTSHADGLEIAGLYCHDSAPGPGAHPDCFQMSAAGDHEVANIKITNAYVIGNTQGINNFGSDQSIIDNFSIDGLYTYIDDTRGFSMTDCNNCSLKNIVGYRSPNAPYKLQFDPKTVAQAVAQRFTGSVTVQNVVANQTRPANYVPPAFVPSPERYPLDGGSAALDSIIAAASQYRETTFAYAARGMNTAATSRSSIDAAAVDLTNPIPEPQTWALMIVGFVTIGVAMRRHQRDKPVPLRLPIAFA